MNEETSRKEVWNPSKPLNEENLGYAPTYFSSPSATALPLVPLKLVLILNASLLQSQITRETVVPEVKSDVFAPEA
jgi:hypothetical protein